jgi:UDP-N-acetylglucosamine 4,6-dehydratase
MDLRGKSVLVTGGTGSFGQTFVKFLLERDDLDRVIVLSRDELKQHDMARTLRDPRVRYFIGDVRDLERLQRAFNHVDVVVHAAALKQVPACEYNPLEAVKTNVLGGANVINAAIDRGVKLVLALSTDKAVSPINLYGATKLCAEKLFVQANSYSRYGEPKFSCVRYGNVVGSRGSVIPVFVEQRARGVITITDKRMTRFWLTLDQGVRFVYNCLTGMHGGEVFVPKIPSMSVMDLAAAIAPGCGIEVTGIRPGEKLHESLISVDEARNTVELENMYVIKPDQPWFSADNWKDGKALPEGFTYTSSHNSDWLSAEQLRTMAGRLES